MTSTPEASRCDRGEDPAPPLLPLCMLIIVDLRIAAALLVGPLLRWRFKAEGGSSAVIDESFDALGDAPGRCALALELAPWKVEDDGDDWRWSRCKRSMFCMWRARASMRIFR